MVSWQGFWFLFFLSWCWDDNTCFCVVILYMVTKQVERESSGGIAVIQDIIYYIDE